MVRLGQGNEEKDLVLFAFKCRLIRPKVWYVNEVYSIVPCFLARV